MPRDGSGVYHRPLGTDAVSDTTIESTKYNNNVLDVEQDLNTPRPIVAGGTAATSADGALDNLKAEKFKQVVTNWDSTLLRAGSLYAAKTATGISPVSGHAFAGICYYANATDLVVEVTDVTSVTGSKYIRMMTAGVWGPWIGAGGGGFMSEVDYTFIDGPLLSGSGFVVVGAGQIMFNLATFNTDTPLVLISHLSASGTDISGVIQSVIKPGNYLNIKDALDKTKSVNAVIETSPSLANVNTGGPYGDFYFTVVSNATSGLVSGNKVLLSTSTTPFP